DPCFVVFFFQAEDGIRDLIVTGVQTCALPILWLRGGSSPKKLSLDEFQSDIAHGDVAEATIKDQDHSVSGKLDDGTSYTVSYPRSEERRVGKECRSGGSAWH